MNRSRTLFAAIALVLGTTAVGTISAATLVPGTYQMTIRTTPDPFPGSGVADTGCTGGALNACANSSFTFGGLPGVISQQMTDNAVTVSNGISNIGGVGGDGVAGIINFTVGAGGALTFQSGSIDTVQGTATGNFAQDLQLGGWTGNIDASGNISFTPTGRLASGSLGLQNVFWNVDDFNTPGNTNWTPFTTGTVAGPAGNVTGKALDAAGNAVLVSSSNIGSTWGSLFSATYYEVWSVDITSTAVPVPAAAWLFGSGLVGLVGVARRRSKKVYG